MNSRQINDNFILLKKTITAEGRLGWKNNAVFGGFGRFFINLAKKQCKLLQGQALALMKSICERSAVYESLSPKNRHELLEEIKPLLEQTIKATNDRVDISESSHTTLTNDSTVAGSHNTTTVDDSIVADPRNTTTCDDSIVADSHNTTLLNDTTVADSVDTLKGVGPKSGKLLKSLGIETILDLISIILIAMKTEEN